MQTRAVHELKTWPAYFAAVRRGDKPFDIRKNDRDFEVGDTVILQEFDPDQDAYTGQTETRTIRFLLSEEDLGVIHGFVVIGFGQLPQLGRTGIDHTLTPQALGDWHALQAENAALRANNALKVSRTYGAPLDGRPMAVAADRHAGVAALAQEEARFHTAAAAILAGEILAPPGELMFVRAECQECAVKTFDDAEAWARQHSKDTGHSIQMTHGRYIPAAERLSPAMSDTVSGEMQ